MKIKSLIFIFCLISSICAIAGENPYTKEWKKVDSLIGKGLTQSALDLVKTIYSQAKSENNSPQFVKSIIYKMKLSDAKEEDSYEKSISDLNEEIKTASYPVSAVLHSVLAEMYWRYYSTNRYLILDRTETANFKQDDIKTWDLKKYVAKIIEHYLASLEKPNELKLIPINLYDAILNNYSSDNFRPTLYDFLAHRAIDYFVSDEPNLISPIYKFLLDKEEYFSLPSEFVNYKIETKDSFSLKFYAIKLLQDLASTHLLENNPQALIDVEIKRLKFLKSSSTLENKDTLYLRTLEKLENKYIQFESSADISYEIALQYSILGATYAPKGDETYKWFIKRAITKCEETNKKYPNSSGSSNCNYLKENLVYPNITLSTEKVNLPDKPFRTLVSFKNTKELYFKIIKLDYYKNEGITEKYYSEKMIAQYLKMPAVKEWNISLSDEGDFQTHKCETKIPELGHGFYIMLASSNKEFDLKTGHVAYTSLWNSTISYESRRKNDYSYDIFVLNRETGLPIVNANAQTYYEKYNTVLRKYEMTKGRSYKTNTDGFFEMLPLESKEYSRTYRIEFSTENEVYVSDRDFYQYNYYVPDTNFYTKTFFFTDRGIYRPGQTVFFKGIILESNLNTSKIKPNYQTTVTFYDVNSQKVADVVLTSNEYGTVNGSFVAPASGLTGQMYISNGYGTKYFSVEEYKRPKFEVAFNPVKGSFKLNEKVSVKGKAKAYAGNAIDGANVKYRVVRTASFPYWGYWWRGYSPKSAAMEITNGTMKTDENGEFVIEFSAIPDLSISKKLKANFNYAVYADVTDINGETHSTQKSVTVGYTALLINVDVPEKLNKSGTTDYEILTTNLSGEREPAKGNISIYKLVQPEKVYRDRKWENPDKFIMTKEEFYKNFPTDLYDDENNSYLWEKGEKVVDKNFDNPKDSILQLTNLKQWKQGQYVMEISTKDKFGESIETKKYFTVFSNEETAMPYYTTDWFSMVKGTCEPGENASIAVGTSYKDVNVLFEVEKNGKIVSKEWFKLNNEQKIISIPVFESDRGNFGYHFSFIKDNRLYIYQGAVLVPYTNKELDIEFETFRDKLNPGQKEEWKIKIRNKNGDKVAAEMLATMYDASLDAFKPSDWNFNIYNSYYNSLNWDNNNSFSSTNSSLYTLKPYNRFYPINKYYDNLNWFGFNYYANYRGYDWDYEGDYKMDEVTVKSNRSSGKSENKKSSPKFRMKEKSKNAESGEDLPSVAADEEIGGLIVDGKVGGDKIVELGPKQDLGNVEARSNFNETAFFYPNIETNEKGDLVVSFTMPESLTKWKMMGFAHTKDLKYGQISKTLVTQKDLMVIPNVPRFLRENDEITLTTKISNISTEDLNGQAQLLLFDASTLKPIDNLLGNNDALKSFSTKKGQSGSVSWSLKIPDGMGPIKYKFVAKAGNFTDGEESVLPVLTNRALVTETMPLPIRGKQSKDFKFEKLINSASSSTLKNFKLTLEFSSNPAWYAIQALPYLMEYPYECAEQTFSRFYANIIASHIANSSPKIKAVFDSWKNNNPDALLSNLEKNQELKNLMLEETPWVLNAKNESERKQRVALLFDLNKMANELGRALTKLEKMQLNNGGFPWFPGMPDSRYITQHIVTGMGHLDHLGVKNVKEDGKVWKMVQSAVRYLDDRIREDYEWLKKYYPKDLALQHIGYDQIQYLYARSYFLESVKIQNRNQEAFDYYTGQAKKYWLSNNKYSQGMISLALFRIGDKTTALDITKSLKENSLNSEEMGMYWKDNSSGYYWYQAPIETQALLVEAFDEVAGDKVAVEDLKVWLLKQKQTQDWKTTKATTEACYALLLRGTDVLASDQQVEISMADKIIDPKKLDDVKIEAGTGYFKTSWSGSDVKAEMGNIKVTKKDDGVAWGAVYWQYFEQLDKITPAETPLKLDKKLFVERITATGPIIEPVTDKTVLKIGDKIKVRIELRVDRDMEYIHMKDMRASGFEPLNVISTYKYQGGLGYYESTKDASTNFFFGYLSKGTYVFEYPLSIQQKGDFSNGITTIQCMYAPEFSAHSEGVRVKVTE